MVFTLERAPAPGHRYSPVRLMCSQPSGEVRNSAGVSRPAFCLAKTASPSFCVFQIDDRGRRHYPRELVTRQPVRARRRVPWYVQPDDAQQRSDPDPQALSNGTVPVGALPEE